MAVTADALPESTGDTQWTRASYPTSLAALQCSLPHSALDSLSPKIELDKDIMSCSRLGLTSHTSEKVQMMLKENG